MIGRFLKDGCFYVDEYGMEFYPAWTFKVIAAGMLLMMMGWV